MQQKNPSGIVSLLKFNELSFWYHNQYEMFEDSFSLLSSSPQVFKNLNFFLKVFSKPSWTFRIDHGEGRDPAVQFSLRHSYWAKTGEDLDTKNQDWAPLSFPFGTFCSFPFFLKNVPFFSVLFSSFWHLMRPKRTQRTQRSFAKNLKECKECNVLLRRT